MICRRATYFADSEMIDYYQKTSDWIASLQKLKTTQQIMPDPLCLKIISYGLRWDIWLTRISK